MTHLLAQYPAAFRALLGMLRHPKHQAFAVGLVLIVGIGVAI